MNTEDFREYCISKKAVSESFPFNETALVFKVGTKMFALLNLSEPSSANLKADPEKALEQRDQYLAVTPGYHMNKKHWNTLMLDGSLSSEVVKEMIDDSYDLVYAKLTKKEQNEIELLLF